MWVYSHISDWQFHTLGKYCRWYHEESNAKTDLQATINAAFHWHLHDWTKCSITFSASKLLLISAPSILVCRSALDVSAPRSFPATTKYFSQVCIHATYGKTTFPVFFIMTTAQFEVRVIKRLSVHLSVCPVYQQQQRQPQVCCWGWAWVADIDWQLLLPCNVWVV